MLNGQQSPLQQLSVSIVVCFLKSACLLASLPSFINIDAIVDPADWCDSLLIINYFSNFSHRVSTGL